MFNLYFNVGKIHIDLFKTIKLKNIFDNKNSLIHLSNFDKQFIKLKLFGNNFIKNVPLN